MRTPKQKYLEEEWEGWKYIWIKEYCPDNEFWDTTLHEAYKINGESIGWTESAVDPMAKPEVLRGLARMLEDDVIFEEQELEEYNRSVE